MASETISDIANDIVSQYWSQEKIEEWMHAAIRDAVKAERDEIAQMIDELAVAKNEAVEWSMPILKDVARTIRARNPQQENPHE